MRTHSVAHERGSNHIRRYPETNASTRRMAGMSEPTECPDLKLVCTAEPGLSKPRKN